MQAISWMRQNAGLICCFVWLLAMCVLGHLLNQYKARYQAAESLVESQQVVTINVLATITLFNDISRTATNDKQTAKQASSQRAVYIRQDTNGNTCVDEFIPYILLYVYCMYNQYLRLMIKEELI